MPPATSADTWDGADQRGSFETTQWSVVLAAGQPEDSPGARAALEKLCRRYWYPLFVYARRRGSSVADAQDAVQEFFARVLERRDLQAVRRERGRFRSYLLAGLKHFLINEWERARAQKRGGGQVAIPLDELIASENGGSAVSDADAPDAAFDRQWALALLGRVLQRLREEHRAEGRERQFNLLEPFLSGHPAAQSQAEIARELGLTENAVKQAVFRLRQRYHKLLRTEIADTVATVGDVEEELTHLIAALRG